MWNSSTLFSLSVVLVFMVKTWKCYIFKKVKMHHLNYNIILTATTKAARTVFISDSVTLLLGVQWISSNVQHCYIYAIASGCDCLGNYIPMTFSNHKFVILLSSINYQQSAPPVNTYSFYWNYRLLKWGCGACIDLSVASATQVGVLIIFYFLISSALTHFIFWHWLRLLAFNNLMAIK